MKIVELKKEETFRRKNPFKESTKTIFQLLICATNFLFSYKFYDDGKKNYGIAIFSFIKILFYFFEFIERNSI
jgi:hypothetical protein